MVDSIRVHDQTHLITTGMLPFPGINKVAADLLDFVSPHLYPRTGKATLQNAAWLSRENLFKDIGPADDRRNIAIRQVRR